MHKNSLRFFLSILQILLTLGPLSAGKKKTTYNFKPAHAPMLSITTSVQLAEKRTSKG